MSDMKVFTVRDLDREPSTVLDAADRGGVVRVKRRDGRTYSVCPETHAPTAITSIPNLAERRKAIFKKSIHSADVRRVDKLIAGE